MMAINKSRACSFTGHRDIPDNIKGYLSKRVIDGIEYLYPQGIRTFLVGGALGFDTLAAKAVLDCREVHADIRLILVVPCRDQAKSWRQADVDTYERIKKEADDVIYLSEYYHKGCMHARNRYLIDNSAFCICYLLRENGGTAYTVQYAKNMGLTVFNIAKGSKAP